jgi:DNA-binding CsgD family transcriptional regulator
MMPAELGGLVEAAVASPALADYERVLFAWLERDVGFDVGFCLRADGLGPHAPGFDERVRRQTAGRFASYTPEYEAMKRDALRGTGVSVDREFFGTTQLERLRAYREVIRPHRGRSSMLVYLEARGFAALLVLGRTRSDFTAAECARLAAARSLITVCELALARRQVGATDGPALSPRERELVQYLRLGYTNREIASACGTSFRTVRNQLSHMFEKLAVSTRAEAVARSFELTLPVD